MGPRSSGVPIQPPGGPNAIPGTTISNTMGTDSRMQPLRLGDRGAAVADVHAALRSLGLLPPSSEPSVSADSSDLETAEFDTATELAIRHFQQIRGLSV